jgi:hypothetical protein
MTTDDKLTEAQLNQRRAAPLKHGLRSEFAETGNEAALTTPQKGRLIELRAQLETPDGVRQAMIDRAAAALILTEWADSWLADLAEREGAVKAFTSPVMGRYYTAHSESRRSLESLAKMQAKGEGGIGADDVLRGLKREQD